MIEVIVLLVIGFIWILFATISDVRTTIIPNWLVFSLGIFALGFRFFYSLFAEGNFNFFFQGLIGLGIFFVIGNALFYGRMFAGGDMKLMIALGTILPLSGNIFTNLEIFVSFLFLFLASGAIYGIFASIYFAVKNFKRFKIEYKKLRKLKFLRFKGDLIIMILGIIIVLGGFVNQSLLYFGIAIFILPVLYIFTKAVDGTMKKKTNPKLLMEGDWIEKDINVGNKTIKANWNGLTEADIKFLRNKNKSIVIKRGVAFGPVFLISFLLLIYFYLINTGLWNSFW